MYATIKAKIDQRQPLTREEWVELARKTQVRGAAHHQPRGLRPCLRPSAARISALARHLEK